MAYRTSSEKDGLYNVIRTADVSVERWPQLNVGRVRLFGIFVHFKYVVLLLAELAVITAAIHYFISSAAPTELQGSGWLLAKSLFASVPFSLCFAGLGLYSSRQTLTGSAILLRYLIASAIAIPLLSALHFPFQAYLTVSDFVVHVFLAILLLAGTRMVFALLPDYALLQRRVLMIGAGEKASHIHEIANNPNQRGFSLVNATVDLSVAGSLIKQVKRYSVSEVVVAFDDRRCTLPAKELLDCRLSGVNVVDVLDFLERETGVIPFEHLQPSWLIFSDGFNANRLSLAAKRPFDVIASGTLIILFLPLILLTSIAIKMDRKSPGTIFYKQIRVGQHGKKFNVFKFRSMRADAEKNDEAKWASKNDPRVTATGAVLRKYRIDELPQLFNVLLGSMSLVGPRPERPVFVDSLMECSDLYTERHRVKPGVTGWAQLRFPYTDNEEDSIQKLQYDMYYLKNQGLVFDIYILLQTIEVVLFGKGSR